MNQLNRITSHFIFLFGIILFFSMCSSRPKAVLNNSEMTSILVEMHKLDGSLDTKGLLYNHNDERAEYYKYLLDKYEITQADFDSSVVWYTKNPKKFAKIYDEVFAQLTKLDEDVKNGKYHSVDSIDFYTKKINLWKESTKFVFSKDSARSLLHFEIKDSTLLYGDIYTLRFLQQIAPEDSCVDQHIIFRINYYNGNVDSVYQKTYNDSLLRRYTFRVPAHRKLKIKSISGELLRSSAYKGTFRATTDSISLMRTYRSDLQDSLRSEVEKIDTVLYKFSKDKNLDSLLPTKVVSPAKVNKKKLQLDK